MRVLFQMSAADSSQLIDSPAAGRLGENRALFYSEEQGRLEKFRPYSPPDDEMLAEFKRRFDAKPTPAPPRRRRPPPRPSRPSPGRRAPDRGTRSRRAPPPTRRVLRARRPSWALDASERRVRLAGADHGAPAQEAGRDDDQQSRVGRARYVAVRSDRQPAERPVSTSHAT